MKIFNFYTKKHPKVGLLTFGLLVHSLTWNSSALSIFKQKPSKIELNKKPDNAPQDKKIPLCVMPDFTAVAEAVMGSVVSIVAQQQSKSAEEGFFKRFQGTPFEDFFKNMPEARPRKVMVGGSGFFISMNQDVAFVATNNHIVKDTKKICILLDDKTEIPAELHGSDPRSDLAVLKVKLSDIPKEKRNQIRPLEWGDSDQSKVGQWVMAIGNPFGLGDTVTVGIISAKSRDLKTGGNSITDDFIQHSAPINQGNSGGCLVNMEGLVIGINTVIITPSGGNVGIGFAIPSNSARSVIQQLIEKKKVRRGALGVKVQEFTKEMAESMGVPYKGGATICWIDSDGPAAKAGLKVGDVVVQFDNKEISSIKALTHVVSDASVDSVHEIKVLREGKELSLKVQLGDFDRMDGFKEGQNTDDIRLKKSEQKPIEILGMSLLDVDKVGEQDDFPRLGKDWKGAVVVKVEPDSIAEDKGLMRGDIIEAVNQKKIVSAQEFKDAVLNARKENKKSLFVGIRRDSVVLYIALPVSEDSPAQESKPEIQKTNPDLPKRIIPDLPQKRLQPNPDQDLEKELFPGLRKGLIDGFIRPNKGFEFFNGKRTN